MILLIDNYDSFSYNLVQLFGSLTPDIKIVRNDKITVEEIRQLNPSHIILSPGPGYPKDAGILEDVVTNLGMDFPILGVCLGEQGICEAFGANIIKAKQLMHGKQSIIHLDNACPLFKGLPKTIAAARYHSLVVDQNGFPQELQITATDDKGEIMAVMHRSYPIYGVQFHPESILTPEGMVILNNFLSIETGGNK